MCGFAANAFLQSPAATLAARESDRLTRIAISRIENGLSRSSRAQARFDQASAINDAIESSAAFRSELTGGLIAFTGNIFNRDGLLTGNSGLFGDIGNSASGGFLLYPNKSNNNQLQSVYSK